MRGIMNRFCRRSGCKIMLYSTNIELLYGTQNCEQAFNFKGFEHFQHSFQHSVFGGYLFLINITTKLDLAFAGIEIFT